MYNINSLNIIKCIVIVFVLTFLIFLFVVLLINTIKNKTKLDYVCIIFFSSAKIKKERREIHTHGYYGDLDLESLGSTLKTWPSPTNTLLRFDLESLRSTPKI